jgi:hypothetical protein
MSEIKRWLVDGNGNNYPSVDGPFVLHSDHEADVARLRAEISALKDDPSYETACETIRKLRAELQNAAKAALDAVALSCEKEREADALRLDAERYRWLRDTPWFDNYEIRSVIAHQLNALWDETIDAAMGASA